MKIFLDTANPELIKKYSPIIDGVTTNPSLIASEKGIPRFHEMIREIVHLVNGPVSVEVISTEYEEMIREAKILSSLSPHIVIKIPIGLEGLNAVQTLNKLSIKTNVTLIFSVNQALLAAKAGATFLSIFVGRLDDTGQNGMDVVKDAVRMVHEYRFSSEVLAASIRHPQHVLEAVRLGTHVSTIPPGILEQMVHHPLTDIGLSKFLDDWKKPTQNEKDPYTLN